MDDFSSMFTGSESKRGRVPTTKELTDFVLEQDFQTRAKIVVGSKAVIFDSDKTMEAEPNPFRIVDSRAMSESDRSNRLDFGALGDAILDRNEDIQERLSEELVVAMQVAPDRVIDMMNRVRADHKKAPVVELDFERGTYEGMIVAQCASQSVMMSKGRAVLLEHSVLDKKPTANSLSRVEYDGERGTVSTLVRTIGASQAASKDQEKGRGG